MPNSEILLLPHQNYCNNTATLVNDNFLLDAVKFSVTYTNPTYAYAIIFVLFCQKQMHTKIAILYWHMFKGNEINQIIIAFSAVL